MAIADKFNSSLDHNKQTTFISTNIKFMITQTGNINWYSVKYIHH